MSKPDFCSRSNTQRISARAITLVTAAISPFLSDSSRRSAPRASSREARVASGTMTARNTLLSRHSRGLVTMGIFACPLIFLVQLAEIRGSKPLPCHPQGFHGIFGNCENMPKTILALHKNQAVTHPCSEGLPDSLWKSYLILGRNESCLCHVHPRSNAHISADRTLVGKIASCQGIFFRVRRWIAVLESSSASLPSRMERRWSKRFGASLAALAHQSAGGSPEADWCRRLHHTWFRSINSLGWGWR